MKLCPSTITCTIISLLLPTIVAAFHVHPSATTSRHACWVSSNQILQSTSHPQEGSSEQDIAVDNEDPKATTQSLLKSPLKVDPSSTTSTGVAQDNEKLSDYFLPDPKDSNAQAFLEKRTTKEKLELQSIMNEIHTHRKQRDFDTSDKLTMQLRRKFGVRLYHGNPSFWTTQKGAAPDSYVRNKQDKSQQAMQDLYGPKGHPYHSTIIGKNDDDDDDDDNPTSCSPLTSPQIQDLLKQRALAQHQGQVETANAIRFELLINGVEINEDTQQWRRTDGRDPPPAVWGSESSSSLVDPTTKDDFVVPSYMYSQGTTRTNNNSSSAVKLDDQTQIRIEQLVKDRAIAVGHGDNPLVQFLSLELQSSYGVVVDDDQRVWSIEPNREDQAATMDLLTSPPIDDGDNNDDSERHPAVIELVPPLLFTSAVATKSKEKQRFLYRESSYSRDISNEGLMRRIDFLIQERVRKREQAKFREADAIRMELWMTYHVGINDQLKQWSVGGVFE